MSEAKRTELRKFAVDFVGQCTLEVLATSAAHAREVAEDLRDRTSNETEMKAQLWEGLQIEAVTPI